MTYDELRKLLSNEAVNILTDEEVDGQRSGDSGQWDDTFDAGWAHGRSDLAAELLLKLFPDNALPTC